MRYTLYAWRPVGCSVQYSVKRPNDITNVACPMYFTTNTLVAEMFFNIPAESGKLYRISMEVTDITNEQPNEEKSGPTS